MMMRNILMTLVIALATLLTVDAQVQTPAPSPSIKIEQAVGMSTITLDYSRPGVKGRNIFGDLVPYGKVWRTGANQATKITFSKDVKLAGKDVKAGTYAMYTIPGEENWEVMLNTDLTIGGNVARYTTDTEVFRATVKAESMPMVMESFMIFLDELRNSSATLSIVWDKTVVSLPIEVDTDKEVMASIERTMAGPSANDYYRAASYYYASEKEMDKALSWINKAVEMRPDAYWIVTTKARILAKMDNMKEAKKVAKQAMEMAEKAGNMDFVKINKGIISGK